jgi:hypothetical protein
VRQWETSKKWDLEKEDHQQANTRKQPWEYDQVCYQVTKLEYKYLVYILND